MRSTLFLGFLVLVGSTYACAVTPALESFDDESPSSSRASKKKKSKATSDDVEESPAPASTIDSTALPPSDDVPVTAPPVQASDTVWTGTLAKTPTSKFGGSPYCEYQTHFEDVNVKVVIGPDGKVKSASVTGKAVEEALNGCPNGAIPPNLHDYSLTSAADGTSFTVNGGGSAAEPHAKLDADVTASGATGSIAIKLVRDDQKAPLVWSISTTVPLTKE